MQDFTNETLDTGGLPKYEEVPLNALSKKYRKVAALNLLVFMLVLAAALAALFYFSVAFRSYLYVAGVIYIVLGSLLGLAYHTDIKKRGFAVREKDILYKSGIIAVSTIIIPFSRIQHIALDEGLFSRMYHLGQLRIFTAGGSSGSLQIPGLEIGQARQIKALLMQQINKADQLLSGNEDE